MQQDLFGDPVDDGATAHPSGRSWHADAALGCDGCEHHGWRWSAVTATWVHVCLLDEVPCGSCDSADPWCRDGCAGHGFGADDEPAVVRVLEAGLSACERWSERTADDALRVLSGERARPASPHRQAG